SGFSDDLIELVEEQQYLPANRGTQTKRYQIVNLFNSGSKPISINQCEPFVIPNDPALSNGDASAHIRLSRRGPGAVPIHRLARKLIGSTIGIALGGGAASGVAHLGVLKVLEQNDIPRSEEHTSELQSQ